VKISQIVPVIEEEIVIVMITILAKVICNCNDYILNVITTSMMRIILALAQKQLSHRGSFLHSSKVQISTLF